MEDAVLAGLSLVPDQALCGFHCFPPLIKSVLLHKQNAWNESRTVHTHAENIEISTPPEKEF